MKPTVLSILMFFALSCSKKTETVMVGQNDTIQQKDGTVLTYEKRKFPLVSLKRDDEVYGEVFQQRLRKIAEYYIIKTPNNLVNFHKQKPDSQLGFSFEKNDWENVDYIQIGIFNKVRNNLSTLQWLFYEPKSQKLYEFDLHKKQLTPFILK